MDDATEDIHNNRLKRVQEKNKRAQARYRQKQKEKMQSFEEQCIRLTEDHKAMAAAYTRLEREKAALEVELRDLRMSISAASAETSGHATSSHQPQLSQPQPVRPHRPVPHASGAGGWDQYPSGEHSFWNSFVRAIVSKQLGEDQAREADKHPFEVKTANEIFAIYKGLIEELHARLSRADRDQSIDTHRGVTEVIHAMRTMGRSYQEGLTKQQRVEGGTALTEEVNRLHGQPQADIWHRVLHAVRVSPGQRDRILDLRASHLQSMEEIIRQRKDIVWELQQATVMPESASKRQAAFAKAVKSANLLQESLAAEHLAKEDFFRRVCHQVLNELQESRMLITAFPYLVDVAAVCDLLAAEPNNVTSDSEGAEEPMRNHGLPAILQIPAVVDSDLTPDLYINAFAWGCDKANVARNGHLGQHPTHQQQPQPQQGFRPPPALFSTSGRSTSGFAPPQFLERHQ